MGKHSEKKTTKYAKVNELNGRHTNGVINHVSVDNLKDLVKSPISDADIAAPSADIKEKAPPSEEVKYPTLPSDKNTPEVSDKNWSLQDGLKKTYEDSDTSPIPPKTAPKPENKCRM